MKTKHRDILLLGFISLLSCAFYLALASQRAGVGFPLDDAWIHQTFARNFARDMQWSFQAGQLSGGSTGPAYGILLAGIYRLGLPAIWTTHFVGFLILWGISMGVYLLVEILLPGDSSAALVCGMLIAMEWHLVWSALSGMETTLLALIAVFLFYWLAKGEDRFWILGVLVGASIWIRPDGITLAGPVLLSLLFRPLEWRPKVSQLGVFLVALALIAGPYFLFNYIVAGDIWPNTFFAKQAEYAVLKEEFFLIRYGKLSLQLITGIGAVLLPGLVREAADMFKRRDWARIGSFAWLIGYLGVYAWRLPVVYQHGRYIMPVMPVYFLLGSTGLWRMLTINSKTMWPRVISRATAAAGMVVLAAFWGLGARAYARDVGVIETEMVQTAKWISSNTPQTAVIGAHDIGALAYFGERRILDLAGLISPDVIPFIRDEGALAAYLDQEQADYLVVFEDWYPTLAQNLTPIYTSSGEFSMYFEMGRMVVYRWE